MNMPIFLAVFFIGCLTITAFIALIIWVAFFEPKNDDYEKTHWIPQEPLVGVLNSTAINFQWKSKSVF
jgi:hypothetical protein